MALDYERFHACPSCGSDVSGLYGDRFVNPADPTEDCPECGYTVMKMDGSDGLRLVFRK